VGEVADRVMLPPLGGELGERLFAGIELGEVVVALERPQLGLVRPGVSGALERATALGTGRVVPAYPPDGVRAAVAGAFAGVYRSFVHGATRNPQPTPDELAGRAVRMASGEVVPAAGTTTGCTALSASQA
jgi:hypothetical protein